MANTGSQGECASFSFHSSLLLFYDSLPQTWNSTGAMESQPLCLKVVDICRGRPPQKTQGLNWVVGSGSGKWKPAPPLEDCRGHAFRLLQRSRKGSFLSPFQIFMYAHATLLIHFQTGLCYPEPLYILLSTTMEWRMVEFQPLLSTLKIVGHRIPPKKTIPNCLLRLLLMQTRSATTPQMQGASASDMGISFIWGLMSIHNC